jgi:hypothetical protein
VNEASTILLVDDDEAVPARRLSSDSGSSR